MNVFEVATRRKFRFASGKGQVGVEDLWDLPLAQLDVIAVALYRQLRSGDDMSFVDPARSSDPTTQLKFDTLKAVLDTKRDERDAATKDREMAERERRLLAVIADREEDALKAKPVDELRRELEAVQNARKGVKAA